MSISEREKIIQRIKKLKAHAESANALGSLEEANAFASKMRELLDEYNISLLEVDAAQTASEDILRDFVYTESISYKHNLSSRWRLELIQVLTTHNYCRFTYRPAFKTFQIYGSFQNVDTVIWLYNYLSIGIERLAANAWKENDDTTYTRHNFMIQFLIGACYGLSAKYNEERRAATQNTMAVIKYNAAALDKFKAEKIGKLKPGRSKEERNVGAATSKGYQAGKSYNIGKPLETGSKNNKKLLG